MIDDGIAVHYSAVPRGTPVYGSDEVPVGSVDQILDNYDEHIFDGVVIAMEDGERRFVDAPEVARTAERAVTLSITSAEAAELPPPEEGAPSFRPKAGGSRLGRILGGGWRKQ